MTSSSRDSWPIELPTAAAPPQVHKVAANHKVRPQADDASSESGNTVFHEDPATQFDNCGGHAAVEEDQDLTQEDSDDDSMNHLLNQIQTEKTRLG